jgi:hypothetical protein
VGDVEPVVVAGLVPEPEEVPLPLLLPGEVPAFGVSCGVVVGAVGVAAGVVWVCVSPASGS